MGKTSCRYSNKQDPLKIIAALLQSDPGTVEKLKNLLNNVPKAKIPAFSSSAESDSIVSASILSKKKGNAGKMQVENHPKKGSIIKVQPITRQKDINSIKRLLSNNPRDYALFITGINSALRGSDLARLKVGDIRGLEAGDHFAIREKKTGKIRNVTINKPIFNAIQVLLALMPAAEDEDYLFASKKGKGPLCTSSINQKVKDWCRAINLRGNFGSHSLRKTWGYHARVTFGMDLASLVDCFGHSTQRQTLTYLCIQEDEVKRAFMNEL